MKPIHLEFVNTGIANRFKLKDHELIEMNWRLKLYPKLFYTVLMHELGHEEGDFKPKDLVHDMRAKTPGLYKFMAKHISAWTMLLPIYWDRKRKGIVYDWNVIVSWWLLIATAYVSYIILRLIL